MPSASAWQQFSGLLLQLPEGWFSVSQQLFSALQASVAVLQIDPGSRQALPLLQRPNSAPSGLSHSTKPLFGSGDPDQPQQSLSARQTSPVGRQPEGGWHT